MRGAHKSLDTRITGIIKCIDDRSIILEPDGLRHGLIIRNMVNRKKLVIAK
jgi:hypothetical protein